MVFSLMETLAPCKCFRGYTPVKMPIQGLSFILVRVAGRIANVTVFRSRISAFRRQNLPRRNAIGVFVKTLQTHNTIIRHSGKT